MYIWVGRIWIFGVGYADAQLIAKWKKEGYEKVCVCVCVFLLYFYTLAIFWERWGFLFCVRKTRGGVSYEVMLLGMDANLMVS